MSGAKAFPLGAPVEVRRWPSDDTWYAGTYAGLTVEYGKRLHSVRLPGGVTVMVYPNRIRLAPVTP